MSTHKKIARTAGVFYILGTVAGILSIAPAVDDAEYLINASACANQVITAAFFQLMMIVAYVGIALVLYPLIRRYNESLALGFLGFRLIAGVCIVIGVIIMLLLPELSQEFVKAGAPDFSYFQIIGELLRAGRDLTNHVAMILALSIGGFMLYTILYQSRLVPRWLSAWGFVGASLAILASALFIFRLIEIIAPTYLVLNVPMALQEMVFAIRLIVKGFNPSVIASNQPSE